MGRSFISTRYTKEVSFSILGRGKEEEVLEYTKKPIALGVYGLFVVLPQYLGVLPQFFVGGDFYKKRERGTYMCKFVVVDNVVKDPQLLPHI